MINLNKILHKNDIKIFCWDFFPFFYIQTWQKIGGFGFEFVQFFVSQSIWISENFKNYSQGSLMIAVNIGVLVFCFDENTNEFFV